MPALADKVKELDATIESKTKAAKEAWVEFDKTRIALAATDVDVSDDSTPEFEAAHEKHRAYGELAEEVDGLKAQRERLWMMLGENERTRDLNGGPAGRDARDAVRDLAHSRHSPGARVVASDAYQAARESGVFDGPGDQLGGRVALGPMFSADEFVASLQSSVIVTDEGGDDTTRPFIIPEQRGLIAPRFRPLLIRDLITIGQVGTDSVEWVLETGWVNNAAIVPEATTDAAVGGGVTDRLAGVKPQSRLTYEKRSSVVVQIAHWVAATKKSLRDVARLQSLIDARLRRGLDDVLEDEIIAGDGSQDHLLGVLNTPGIQWQDAGEGVFLENVLRAMTKVQLAFFQIQATALNPLDWQEIRLLRDDSGAGPGTGPYMFGPPSQAGATTLWGYPVVSGPQFPQGTAVTGDWRTVEYLVREGVSVVASDSHADFFVRNLVAVLAETAGVLIVPQPEALCEVSSTQPS